MRKLVGREAQTRKVAFLGEADAVEVRKLTGAEVKEFQAFIKEGVRKLPEESQGIAVQTWILRKGVLGADDLTDEELDTFPYEDLADLAKEVLLYSGISSDSGNAKD